MRAILTLVACAGIVAAGCGGKDRTAAPVRTTSCSDVYYEGEGAPNAIIVSDLPREGGPGKATATLMVDAIKFTLRRRGFRAGEHRIGYQACNDTVGEEPFDEGLCERNAKAYADTGDVVGMIGPWNSGCAYVQVPILSRDDAGPLAMVSPSNTYVGLTRDGPGANPGDPDKLYSGVRNYARVVPHDFAQATALVSYAKTRGMKRAVTIADERDPYGSSVSGSFIEEARAHGLSVTEFDWRPLQSYTGLARRIARKRPELVYMAGLPQFNAKRLVEDLRAELGDHVEIAGSDAFLDPDVAEGLGSAGEGLLVTSSGYPQDELPAAGKAFLTAFGKPGYAAASGYGAPEAAQAAEVLLDAIARSNGTRASIVEALFETRVKDGILGSFGFDSNGDVVPATGTVYRTHDGRAVVDRVVRVSPSGE